MGDPHLTLRALVLADQRPYVPLARLLERQVDLVLCLGDLSRVDLEALADARLPKLGVYGNHDEGDEFDGIGIEDVHLRRIEVAGLCFGGFSGSHEYHEDRRFTWTQKKASKLLRKLGHVDVMLAHSPPLGINDDPDDPAHIGFDALRPWVLEHQPRWLLHGHVHPTPGSLLKRIGDTRVVYVNGARVIDLT